MSFVPLSQFSGREEDQAARSYKCTGAEATLMCLEIVEIRQWSAILLCANFLLLPINEKSLISLQSKDDVQLDVTKLSNFLQAREHRHH